MEDNPRPIFVVFLFVCEVRKDVFTLDWSPAIVAEQFMR